jgi:hypothetical protein
VQSQHRFTRFAIDRDPAPLLERVIHYFNFPHLFPRHVSNRKSSGTSPKIFDHRIFELADFRTSLPRERNRSPMRLFSGERFGPPDRGSSVRTLDRFATRQRGPDRGNV